MLRLAVPALVVLALAVTGCSGDVSPLRQAYMAPAAKPVAAPEFVAGSRKTDETFLPVGVSAPARPIRARSSEGAKALAAELEGARGANEAKGRAAESAARATKPASATP
ncbi:hypothetical protein [Methylobacterium sp. Leaf108]|uniref:hypothetical protein n=1 Tax=Methylobacterium sp. Leaf108 TaxID=1736256 RepID=UPI0006FB09C3|nr:hypothetical protein [Methylobacterium sp. Leaf108]KQP52606.1 hypothetical protein ASF39_06750 [Methylobacterium sp. Leaf108]